MADDGIMETTLLTDDPELEQDEEALETSAEDLEEPTYWAMFGGQEFIDHLLEKREKFLTYFKRTDLYEKVRRSYLFYHGQYYEGLAGGAIKLAGEEWEQRRVAMNEYRSTLSLLATYVVGQKPAWDTLAGVADYSALEATKLGNSILDTYMADPITHVEACLTQAVTDGLVMSSGYVWNRWAGDRGPEVDGDPESGVIQYGGDFEFRNPSILDVVYDFQTREFKDSNWVLVRSKENKYDLIAQFPEVADKLEDATLDDEQVHVEETDELAFFRMSRPDHEDEDHVWVYYFYHKRSPALPQGRVVRFTADSILEDRALVEEFIPVHRLVPSQYLMTCFGYTHAFDLQPMQEAINALLSIIVTNANALGHNKIWAKTGEPINIADLEPGISLIQTETPPQSLNFLNDSPSLSKNLEMFQLATEKLSGVNSTSRGAPDYQLQSGSALAMVDSRTLQAASELIQNYRRLLCDVGTSILKTLANLVEEPRLINLVGTNGRRFVQEFRGELLAGIKHVSVQSSNPLTDTLTGRAQTAQFLATTGLIKTPQELITTLKTGDLDRLTENAETQLRATQWENDALLQGKPVQMLLIDDHRYHIVKHSSIFDDPELRSDPVRAKNGLAHIMQHVEALMDPKGLTQGLQTLLGYAPAPMAAPGGPPKGGGPPKPTPQQTNPNPAPKTKGVSGPVAARLNDARMNTGMAPDTRDTA